ncbi:hypothetical protein [Sanguibacter sp. Z1732]
MGDPGGKGEKKKRRNTAQGLLADSLEEDAATVSLGTGADAGSRASVAPAPAPDDENDEW